MVVVFTDCIVSGLSSLANTANLLVRCMLSLFCNWLVLFFFLTGTNGVSTAVGIGEFSENRWVLEEGLEFSRISLKSITNILGHITEMHITQKPFDRITWILDSASKIFFQRFWQILVGWKSKFVKIWPKIRHILKKKIEFFCDFLLE